MHSGWQSTELPKAAGGHEAACYFRRRGGDTSAATAIVERHGWLAHGEPSIRRCRASSRLWSCWLRVKAACKSLKRHGYSTRCDCGALPGC